METRLTRQTPRPRHKGKAIIRLSSHPSCQLLCFHSKLVAAVVVTGLIETRLYGNQALTVKKLLSFVVIETALDGMNQLS